MKIGSGPQTDLTPDLSRRPEPKFLVQLEPWHRNLTSFLTDRNRDTLSLTSSPGEFWSDVFVPSPLPWRRFLDSAVYHALAIVVLWGAWQLGWGRPRLAPPSTFNRADVIYYPESEYLPPLNSRRQVSYQARKGQPEYARQDIISVPSDPDNQRQTIVTPPKIKLDHDVPMPNMVAWSPTPSAIPLAATERTTADMKLPQLPTSVVAPPPDVKTDSSLRSAAMPEPPVVSPPPSVQMASARQLGDIDIGHSEVVAPAPQLPMQEQHQPLGGSANSTMMATGNVVPPPPSMGGATRGSQGGGQLIALSVRPAPTAPAQLPQGNRRGTFAATPQGKPGAPGTPDIPAGTGEAGSGGTGNAPAGLYVGRGSNPAAVQGTGTNARSGDSSDGPLVASANPPRVGGAQNVREVSPEKVSDEEKKVFAGRKFYGMSLNMPNLNSAGGSWVIHFAELKDDSQKGDLSAPVAEKKVDPAYPTELMRQNVAGTVTLAAVIHSDGSVDGVHVLSSADDRLNEYARSAFVRWRFRPATKNGNPVDLQAVVTIPFHPVRWKNGF